MALKGDRHELQTDISFFCNDSTNRTKGMVVCLSTAGSGAAMDSSVALATVKNDPSGAYPLGILLNDVTDIDLTRQHVNWHKDEVIKGGKVTILRKGWVVTNHVTGSPTVGATAYVNGTGTISTTQMAGAAAIGAFLSSKDADGYAKVEVNLP